MLATGNPLIAEEYGMTWVPIWVVPFGWFQLSPESWSMVQPSKSLEYDHFQFQLRY